MGKQRNVGNIPPASNNVRTSLPLLLAVLLPVCFVRAGEDTNTYKADERVRVYAGQIGPLHNTFETYSFFRTPGCPPASWSRRSSTLGQALTGRQLQEMGVNVRFGKNVTGGVMCTFTPKQADIKRWRKMIQKKYVYELYVDELPIWVLLGEVTPAGPVIYLHRRFHIETNKNQIVHVTLEAEQGTVLTQGRDYTFTYSVIFTESQLSFEDRFKKYVDQKLFEPRFRWISVINSVILALLLSIINIFIVSRAIHADLKGDEDELGIDSSYGLVEGSGWKQLSADVYRVPPYPMALCALLGTGAQLLLVFVAMIMSAAFYNSRHKPTYGAVTVVTEAYALTGFVAGYVSASKFVSYTVYKPALASRWMHCMYLTIAAFPAAILFCGVSTNAIAYLYGSARALHVGGVAYVALILVFLFCPTVVVGTLTGRYIFWRRFNAVSNRNSLPHVNQIPRLVPRPPYRLLSRPYLILLTGALPFSSVVLELFLVFSCIWMNKLYYLYYFLLIGFTIFLVIACFTSIAATYLLLNMEDHRWQWMAFGFGASTGIFIFIHATYFYFFQTSMSGMFMLVFYFAYSALFSLAMSLAGGCVTFLASSQFVQKIYTSVKLE
ncbi:endosomal integral membrane protein, putative [Trypanosoma brucei gambiense DAL972]|uniref:Transmembrane 9 superfamily member n=1 Tax=Trypanosoma brucei gambiense (strain MHOM/CI/86/DAL972) TaxID=679716 RepID=D0A6H3_TRYB9|nr:endosomal integral membrane protein, putative [Trypanosoma brucei gambiense DAL972]CBH17274.1 endosomal integral membrane protein, putative [Trypanosoma brucei gambiense DAL972]|eukprot:XP_011779538.1 endosomal integral membrane protein, putative [Trypanosoma brucei gambiense DAL972]